ncbi:hypothetical protein HPB51_003270 [Rhipicephalus microplus]|uniref:Phosphatidylinositol transfer protein sec14 n=1 Tax=Rhipicephalus microplus TaxID=6941 RepID=A0A9J6EWM7_RHIMP|nr:hypothetical protein HPB51_003270 [Rhipicephalus microplus]
MSLFTSASPRRQVDLCSASGTKIAGVPIFGGGVSTTRDPSNRCWRGVGRRGGGGLFYSVKKSDFIRHIIQQLEYSAQDMAAQTEKLGRVIEMHSFIFDLENFNLKQIAWKPALDMIINLVTMYEDHYPEMLKKAYVINAPKIYPIIYNMVKPFLSEETAKKIHVFGKDKWKDALLQDIAPEELPVHWGGTMTGPDGDPRCTHIVGAGGPVPCSCYTAPSRRLSSDQNLKMCVVEKKSAVPLTVEVTEAGSILRWEFQTENYDIGFGVFFVPDSIGAVNGDGSGDMQELVAMQRVNCHLVPEDGMLVCSAPGKYVLKFDNSFSWYRSKKLLYHYQVLPPTPA